MLELREKKLNYIEPRVSVQDFHLSGVNYFYLFLGDMMYIVEKEPIYYA